MEDHFKKLALELFDMVVEERWLTFAATTYKSDKDRKAYFSQKEKVDSWLAEHQSEFESIKRELTSDEGADSEGSKWEPQF